MPVPNERSLRAKLAEDLGSEAEARQLLPVARRLRDWPAPAPSRLETARLAAQLASIQAKSRPRPSLSRLLSPLPWLLLRTQLRVMHRELWVASALVMGLGALLTGIAGSPGAALPLALLAPVVAAVGVALIYGVEADPALELELALPLSPRLILLARLALVFAFNLGLGLLASLILVATNAGLSFGPLVSAWLAPMAFLSALSFFITVLRNDSGMGILVSLGLWASLNLLHFMDPISHPWLARLPEFFSPQAMPWLWAMAAALGAGALWLAGSEDHCLQPRG